MPELLRVYPDIPENDPHHAMCDPCGRPLDRRLDFVLTGPGGQTRCLECCFELACRARLYSMRHRLLQAVGRE